jgi:hypothetical protein
MNVIVHEGLLKLLREQFPNRLPNNPQVTLGDVRQSMGEQKVIDYLEFLQKQQNPTEELLQNVFSRST